MFSPLRAFSEDEWDRLNAWLDRIYDDFTAKVADGRRLPRDHVDEIARGRVWTGADAKERGLVDELGGLRVALDVARERAGLAPSDELDPRVYPPGSRSRRGAPGSVERGSRRRQRPPPRRGLGTVRRCRQPTGPVDVWAPDASRRAPPRLVSRGVPARADRRSRVTSSRGRRDPGRG